MRIESSFVAVALIAFLGLGCSSPGQRNPEAKIYGAAVHLSDFKVEWYEDGSLVFEFGYEGRVVIERISWPGVGAMGATNGAKFGVGPDGRQVVLVTENQMAGRPHIIDLSSYLVAKRSLNGCGRDGRLPRVTGKIVLKDSIPSDLSQSHPFVVLLQESR